MTKLFASLPGLGIAAENGFFYRPPYSEEWEQMISDNELDLSWKEAVVPIFVHFTDRTPGRNLEKLSFISIYCEPCAKPLFSL